MMYQIVQASSADEATKMFVGHPQFGVPQASIEVMPLGPWRADFLDGGNGRGPALKLVRAYPISGL